MDTVFLGHESHSSRRSHLPADDLFGNCSAASDSLAAMRKDHSSWKPTVPTNKLVQRQLLCKSGWLWERRNCQLPRRGDPSFLFLWPSVNDFRCFLMAKWRMSRGLLVNLGNIARRLYSYEERWYGSIMNSNITIWPSFWTDETHQKMSGSIAALAPHAPHSVKSTELREHNARLVIRPHCSYFRVLLTHLAVGRWSDTLEEEIIPFRERLAIAFQLLDVKSLSSYLRRMTEQACLCGDIDAIILMGLTFSGMDFLQSYVDRTGDVQSAAILSSSVCPQRFKDRRTERWLESYRDLLDVV